MNQPHNPLESPNGAPELNIEIDNGRDDQVSIIVIHHNKPEYLNICLQSLHVCSHLNNYEVIVVDNASTDKETADYLDVLEKEGIKIVRNVENNYWSEACNQGVAVADDRSSHYIFLHCDTVILNPAWIDVLVGISISKESGMVGTKLQEYYIQKQKVQFVEEWCLLISKQCWKSIGPWPKELPLVGMSFIMTLRAQYAGFKPQITGNSIVHHFRSLSIDPNDYERLSEDAMSKMPDLMQKAQSN